jgi:hypothetical protein
VLALRVENRLVGMVRKLMPNSKQDDETARKWSNWRLPAAEAAVETKIEHVDDLQSELRLHGEGMRDNVLSLCEDVRYKEAAKGHPYRRVIDALPTKQNVKHLTHELMGTVVYF